MNTKMMKRVLLLVIIIGLANPEQAFCLRPKATKTLVNVLNDILREMEAGTDETIESSEKWGRMECVMDFVKDYPGYPTDRTSLSALMNLDYEAKSGMYSFSKSIQYLRKMLSSGVIDIEDVPYVARISQKSNSYVEREFSTSIFDLVPMPQALTAGLAEEIVETTPDLALSNIELMLKRGFIKREEIKTFLWPMVEKLYESRRLAVHGIYEHFDSGFTQSEIRELYNPIADSDNPQAGAFLFSMGALLKEKCIDKSQVKNLFIPLLEANKMFAYVQPDTIKRFLDTNKKGELSFLDFCRPFLKAAANNKDPSFVLWELRYNWDIEDTTLTPDDMNRYLLPLFNAAKDAPAECLLAIRSGIRMGKITKNEVLQYLLPLFEFFGEQTPAVFFFASNWPQFHMATDLEHIGKLRVRKLSGLESSELEPLRHVITDFVEPLSHKKLDSEGTIDRLIIPLIDRALKNIGDVMQLNAEAYRLESLSMNLGDFAKFLKSRKTFITDLRSSSIYSMQTRKILSNINSDA